MIFSHFSGNEFRRTHTKKELKIASSQELFRRNKNIFTTKTQKRIVS